METFKESRQLTSLVAQIKIQKIKVSSLEAGKISFRAGNKQKRKRDDTDEELRSNKKAVNSYCMFSRISNNLSNISGVNSKVQETVEDILAQFEPCDEFVVESDGTLNSLDCRICNLRVKSKLNQTSKNALTVHYINVHKVERYYQCDKCDMILPSIDVWFIERHQSSTGCRPKTVNGYKSDVIKCEKCDQTFDKNSSYRDHYKKKHTNIIAKDSLKKKVLCKGCGLKFTTQTNLSLHEVYEQKLCKVPCSVCGFVIDIKLNCKMEKHFKESGLVNSVRCPKCTS